MKHDSIRESLIAQAKHYDVEHNWHQYELVRVLYPIVNPKWGRAFSKGEYALAWPEGNGTYLLWTPKHNDHAIALAKLVNPLRTHKAPGAAPKARPPVAPARTPAQPLARYDAHLAARVASVAHLGYALDVGHRTGFVTRNGVPVSPELRHAALANYLDGLCEALVP